jgi:hypothetical protein
VHADADDIAGRDALGDDLLQRLIYKDGITGDGWGCCCQDEEPPWCDDCRSKRIIAGVDQMDANFRAFPRSSTVASGSIRADQAALIYWAVKNQLWADPYYVRFVV